MRTKKTTGVFSFSYTHTCIPTYLFVHTCILTYTYLYTHIHADNDGREGSLVALEEAKRSYREIYEEMQLCKVQVQEMQTLKQKTMASLVTSFQQYQTAFISNVQHV